MMGRRLRATWTSVIASLGQERALANARLATVECCRRRLERAKVELYLAGIAARRAG